MLQSTMALQLGRVVGLDVNTATNSHRILGSSQTGGMVVSTAIVGICAEASTGAQDTELPVWEANPNVEFRANVSTGLALTSSNIGTKYALSWDSTRNIHLVAVTNSTAAVQRVVVTGFIDSLGDTGGAVSFKFLTRTEVGSTDNCLAFFK
jgi:ATP/ADP translocase